jgi:hypothetical protein
MALLLLPTMLSIRVQTLSRLEDRDVINGTDFGEPVPDTYTSIYWSGRLLRNAEDASTVFRTHLPFCYTTI